MYPARFEYHAPASVDEALAILERYGDEAKVLAGGQSLIPLMKLRFASPRALVDINRIEGLDAIAGGQRLPRRSAPSSATRTASDRTRCKGRYGVLGDAAPQISDPIVRNRGTVVGSLAHADPQGDWGSALLAAGAQLEVASSGGTRTIPLDELFQGPFTTSLQPNEIATAVQVPDPGPRAGGTYLKLERKVGDYATVGVAVHLSFDNGKVGRAGIALTGVGPRNLRATAAEEALAGAELNDDTIKAAARARRRGRAAAERRARERRLQAERRPRLHGARAPQGGRDGAGRLRGGTMTETAVEAGAFTRTGHRDGQRRRALGGGRDAAPARPLPPRDARAHRHAHRLRHDELRRLHGAPGRDAGEVLHDVRRPGRRARGHDGRGAGRPPAGSARCRRASTRSTGSSAASARRG